MPGPLLPLLGALAALSLGACATIPEVKLGDTTTEASLKRLAPLPSRASLYFCRPVEEGSELVDHIATMVLVDDTPVGTLAPNHFTHTVV